MVKAPRLDRALSIDPFFSMTFDIFDDIDTFDSVDTFDTFDTFEPL